jgi:hypothetical protein
MARITTDPRRLMFAGGLPAPGSATVVRAGGMITDGPYLAPRGG